MKTVVVLNQFALPRSEGGGTRHIDLFSRVEGWRAVIVAGNRNHYSQTTYQTADTTFKLVRVPKQGKGLSRLVGWLAYCAQAIFVTVRAPRLAAVYASTPHLLAPLAGFTAAKIRRVPFILEVRDLWPKSMVDAGLMAEGGAIHRVLAAVERFVVRRADSVVVVTAGWEDHFAGLGLDPERLHVIPNGAELDDFAVSESREQLRQRHKISGFTAVFAGAHGPKDGIDLILDAAAEQPDINFLLIGAGPAKADAMTRANRDGIVNVAFRDPVAKSELPSILHACDVGIHAVAPLDVFDKGMSPNKLFDYLACNLPVVSNADVALREVIVDDQCGRIGPVHSLAASLGAVRAAQPADLRRWTNSGRQLMEGKFSRSVAAGRLRAILDEHSSDGGSDAPSLQAVAHMTTAHPPFDNRIFAKECVALASRGFDVSLIAQDAYGEMRDGVRLMPLPAAKSRVRRVLNQRSAWSRFRQIRPAVLHLHDPELIPLGAIAKTFTRTRVVYDAHEDLAKQVAGKDYIPTGMRQLMAVLATLLLKVADRYFDAIVAATPAIARTFKNPNVVLVQNFPWRRQFPPPASARLTNQVFTACYVGAITPERGLGEMLAGIRASASRVLLVLAGPVSQAALSQIDAADPVTTRYIGTIPVTEVPATISGADVGLALLHALPNYLESQSTKIYEYMAAGKPFIASNFPAWVEQLGPFDCGIFVDPYDPAAVASAVDHLASDRSGAQEMGSRGREAFENFFTFDREALSLERLMRQWIHQHASAGPNG